VVVWPITLRDTVEDAMVLEGWRPRGPALEGRTRLSGAPLPKSPLAEPVEANMDRGFECLAPATAMGDATGLAARTRTTSPPGVRSSFHSFT
jgi:hypothetical protein